MSARVTGAGKAGSRRVLSGLRDDPYLRPYEEVFARRRRRMGELRRRLTGGQEDLAKVAADHERFGLFRREGGWVLSEWAPHASEVGLIGPFSDWRWSAQWALQRAGVDGAWEIRLPADALRHGDLYRLHVRWPGGEGDRIPAYARRVVQDERTLIFNAQVWDVPFPYRWRHPARTSPVEFPLIYEAHVGMAQEREGVGTYEEFRTRILPRIVRAGYNTVQLMAVMEHPYYGSFGYQVSSFFAASSRFGTPEELKGLIDEAHGSGLAVIMDLVHSHAAPNEVEGLSRFDGTLTQYFHEGERGIHPLWGSRCFDYGKPAVLRFLLSNCRFWLEEYRLDGFRFDGVTSMLYRHHGFGKAFTSYDDYFGEEVDEDALAYLALANEVVHAVRPDALMVAEDVSGMPGLAASPGEGGCGFDYRLAMGVPDCWFRLAGEVRDEEWDIGRLWHELTNRRDDEQVIGYVESHDQALVGGKSLIFQLINEPMYRFMRASDRNLEVERGIALHKMARLATLATTGHGYLNFMGNEFGHPEWIDFPRLENGWSYKHARRQWRLMDDPTLRYRSLAEFDREMLRVFDGHAALAGGRPRLLRLDHAEKILVFERGGAFFLFNFHPAASRVDEPVEMPCGEYRPILDTDQERFGGQGRIEPRQRFLTHPVVSGDTLRYCIRVYLPCRTALVLQKVG
jgi:1,4-alpha-glucan branching enzyme